MVVLIPASVGVQNYSLVITNPTYIPTIAPILLNNILVNESNPELI
jgi:hypothetical protein